MAPHSSSTDEISASESSQPKPTPDLSLVEAAVPKRPVTKPKKKASTSFRRFRSGLGRLGAIIYDGLVALAIMLLYVVPGAILVIPLFALVLGLSLGISAAYGAIALLIGNAILRAAHLAHYTDNAMAAAIGATGSLVAMLIVGLVSRILPTNADGQIFWPFGMFIYTLLMTLSGTLGAAILKHNHVDLRGTDVLHATRAGALGGAILGPGSILATPFILLALGIVFSPLFIAMQFGLRWVYVRSSESWDDRGRYKRSHCHCYGTCGDDSDIEEELQQLPAHLRP